MTLFSRFRRRLLRPLVELGGRGVPGLRRGKSVFLSCLCDLPEHELGNLMREFGSNWQVVTLGLEAVLVGDVGDLDQVPVGSSVPGKESFVNGGDRNYIFDISNK